MYKGPYADLIFNTDEEVLPLTDEVRAHVENLKKNIQIGSLPHFEKATPAQNKKRHRALCAALDNLSQTNIGRMVLVQVPPDVRILSFTADENGPLAGVHAIAWGYLQIVNISPETLFNRPYFETMEALSHELMHISHYYLEEETLHEFNNAGNSAELNAYDKFALKFLNEAGAHLTGQRVSDCFKPDIREILSANKGISYSLTPLFRNIVYWQEHYREALENLSVAEDVHLALRPVHSKAYYAVQRAYFELHPELQNAHITRLIHKGFKMFTDIIQKDLNEHPQQKLSAKQFIGIYRPIIPYVAQTAQNLKV